MSVPRWQRPTTRCPLLHSTLAPGGTGRSGETMTTSSPDCAASSMPRLSTPRTFAGSMLRGIAAEDIAVTHGKMSGDIVYQIDCSWSRRPCDPPWGDVTMRVVGTKGAAGLDLYNDYRVEIFTPAGIEFRYPNALCYEHARVFLDYQMEKVAGIRGANADEIDGLRTMELVFASYESAAKKSTITIHQHKP